MLLEKLNDGNRIHSIGSVCERYFFSHLAADRCADDDFVVVIGVRFFLSIYLLNFLFILSLCVSFRFVLCVECACKLELKDFIPVCATCLSIFFSSFFFRLKQKDMYSFSHIYYTLDLRLLCPILHCAFPFCECSFSYFWLHCMDKCMLNGIQLTGANASENL